jgi:hypothetical protein
LKFWAQNFKIWAINVSARNAYGITVASLSLYIYRESTDNVSLSSREAFLEFMTDIITSTQMTIEIVTLFYE